MLKFSIILVQFLVFSVYGSGDFTVLHHPSSLVFKGHDRVKESTLRDIYTAALGFSTERYSNWQGMFIENPFDLPKAIVAVAIDGVDNIGLQKGHHFPLKTDVSEQEVYRGLERNVLARFPVQNPILIRVELSDGLEDAKQHDVFKGIHSENPKHVAHKILKINVDEDRQFLKEVTLLHEIAQKIEQGIEKKDGVRDVFWFQLTSLHALSDLHGENSTETSEAKQILNEAILRINTAFSKAYEGKVLVTVITSDASHTRRSRSILADEQADEEKSDKEKYNLASYYNADYPVIFNIILWFGVAMLFSLIAISLAIGNMDPGRDSIIYRMTSTRMKKDN